MRIGSGVFDPEWYRIILNDRRSLSSDELYIREMFDRAFFNRNKPSGMSLWLERENDGNTIYYLSPVSVTTDPGLVHHLNAVRCAKPSATAYLIAGAASQDA